MIILDPGQTTKLSIHYQEDGAMVSGLTDLSVIGKDDSETIVLASTILTEIGASGEYSYIWNMGNTKGYVTILFYKGSELLCSEEYYITVFDDGQAF